ncbi:unnamed protein product [Dimorphilus gyrociliatus]|uniref:Uncharacterized protein n=1 Tax=Dimorphilus gyrociliatus TaxID=2664684 RepID=A0A7I8VWW3_9ANNE|nr:unnamed protein product [Dimorphilus gyrociliatus]
MNAFFKHVFYLLKIIIDYLGSFLFKITGYQLVNLTYEKFEKQLSSECRKQIKDTIAEKAIKILLNDLDNCPDLSIVGRFLFKENYRQVMENRCNLYRIVKKDQSIRQVAIKDPVAILTLPRTGSTFFHCLLAQDKRWKVPELWEMLNITHLPEDPLTLQNRRTIADTKKKFEMILRLYSKNFELAHPLKATNPEDLLFILSTQGIDMMLPIFFNVPNYEKFLQNLTYIDWLEIYNHVKLYFQAMGFKQNIERRRLLFMVHLSKYCNLEALKTVFPDCRFITLHRDPVVTCQSWFSLMSFATGVTYVFPQRHEDFHHLSNSAIENCIQGCNKLVDTKGNCGHIHLPFSELQLNPLKLIKEVYNQLEIEWTADCEKAFHDFIKYQRDHRCGVHKYRYMKADLSKLRIGIENYIRVFNEYIK